MSLLNIHPTPSVDALDPEVAPSTGTAVSRLEQWAEKTEQGLTLFSAYRFDSPSFRFSQVRGGLTAREGFYITEGKFYSILPLFSVKTRDLSALASQPSPKRNDSSPWTLW